jgi:hypothetical protein
MHSSLSSMDDERADRTFPGAPTASGAGSSALRIKESGSYVLTEGLQQRNFYARPAFTVSVRVACRAVLFGVVLAALWASPGMASLDPVAVLKPAEGTTEVLGPVAVSGADAGGVKLADLLRGGRTGHQRCVCV